MSEEVMQWLSLAMMSVGAFGAAWRVMSFNIAGMVGLTCSVFSRQLFLEDGGLWKGQILLFELVGRQVAQAAVRPHDVVMAPPSLDDHRCFARDLSRFFWVNTRQHRHAKPRWLVTICSM